MDKKLNLIVNIFKKPNTRFYLAIFLISLVYLFLRLIYPDTIEFGYDQPRLSYTVLDFVRNGNFLNSQNYSLATSWGNLSWGPLLVMFNSLFLSLTTNPISISQMMVLFNLFSVILVMYIGREFFSKRVAIFAGLVLAIHPWWIVFSRMIYQPTPIPTFILVSTLFLFKTIKQPKSYWLLLLILSWVLLLQSYLITISFILLSSLILIYETKLKINYKIFLIALFVSVILFIPSFKYYFDNPSMFYNFLHFKGKFATSFSDAFMGFVKTLPGNNFEWQLGYAYKIFMNSFKYLSLFHVFNSSIIMGMILISICVVVIRKNKYMLYVFLFLTLPLITLPAIGVEYVVPRYFLYVLPFLSLSFGISMEYLIDKYGKTVIILPFLIFISWIVFIFNYFNFVKTYSYPNGFLSNWSDVPYSYLDESFKWITKDSGDKGYTTYTVSSDLNFPTEFRLTWAQRYYWEYILKRDENVTGKVGHYVMRFTPLLVGAEKDFDYQQFGPYVVYEYSN